MVTHTVACYRNSTKCKVCGERLKKSMKSAHLAAWRDPARIVSALERNKEDELIMILDHGVTPDHVLGPNKQSMVHLCAMHNANDCILLLISRGADTDPLDEVGCTPLHVALQKGNTKVAASLIELGANIESK